MKKINGSFSPFFIFLGVTFNTPSHGMEYKTECANRVRYVIIKEDSPARNLDTFLKTIVARIMGSVAKKSNPKIGLDYNTQLLAYFKSLGSDSQEKQAEGKRQLLEHATAVSRVCRLSGIKICYEDSRELQFVAALLEPHIKPELEFLTMSQVSCDKNGKVVLNKDGSLMQPCRCYSEIEPTEKLSLASGEKKDSIVIHGNVGVCPTPVLVQGNVIVCPIPVRLSSSGKTIAGQRPCSTGVCFTSPTEHDRLTSPVHTR